MSYEEDPRFQSMHSAPIFKKSNKSKQKTKLDERFVGALTDSKFNLTKSVDRYGRKTKKSKDSNELSEFYSLQHDDEDGKPIIHDSKHTKTSKDSKPTKTSNDSKTYENRLDYLNKLSRGEISNSESESENENSSSESEDEFERGENNDNGLSLITKELEPDEDDIIDDNIPSTKRIAIMNCDWENIKAIDLMVILQSFCPQGKQVLRVTVYPSDFGIKQMQYEQLHGPQLWDNSNSDPDDDSESFYESIETIDKRKGGDFQRPNDSVGIVLHDELVRRGKAKPDEDINNDDESDNEGIDEEKLRIYELRKLKYYFAVAEFDSPESAEILRQQLDGVELEHSSMALDLRVIPDDLSFDDRKPRDSCDFVPTTYEPPEVIVNALQHTKVQCSWDIGETQREKKLTNFSLWKNLQESDLQQYVADEDSDNDDDVKALKAKNLRKLLLGDDAEYSDDENNNNHDEFFLEESKLSNNTQIDENKIDKSLSFIPSDEQDDDNFDEENETVLERELRIQQQLRKKRKEKKKQLDNSKEKKDDKISTDNEIKSKEQLELLFAGEDQNENDYNMIQLRKLEKQAMKKNLSNKTKKKIKNKNLLDLSNDGIQSEFVVNVNDNRFKTVFEGSDPRYGIDKTSSEYKETIGMKTILKTQLQKRLENNDSNIENKIDSHSNSKIDESFLNKIKRKFSSIS